VELCAQFVLYFGMQETIRIISGILCVLLVVIVILRRRRRKSKVEDDF
jgi:hypothetical protein